MGLGFGIRKGNRVGYGISIPLSSRASETLEFAPPFFSRTLLSRQAWQSKRKRALSNWNWPAQKPLAGRNKPIVCIAVRVGMPSFGKKCSGPRARKKFLESPDTMAGQIYFNSVTYRFWLVKLYKVNNSWTKTGIIYFQKKLLLRAYSTLKHSLSSTKLNYSSKMKINLCVLIGTLSARVKTTGNPQHVKYRVIVHIL